LSFKQFWGLHLAMDDNLALSVHFAVTRLRKLPTLQRPGTVEKLGKWLLRQGCCTLHVASLVSPVDMANAMADLLKHEFPELWMVVAAFASKCSETSCKDQKDAKFIKAAATRALNRLRHVADWFLKQPVTGQATWLDSQAVAVVRTDPSALVSALIAHGIVQTEMSSDVVPAGKQKLRYDAEGIQKHQQHASTPGAEEAQMLPASSDSSAPKLAFKSWRSCASHVCSAEAKIPLGHGEVGEELCKQLHGMKGLCPLLMRTVLPANAGEPTPMARSMRFQTSSRGSMGQVAVFKVDVAAEAAVTESMTSTFKDIVTAEIQRRLSIEQFCVESIHVEDAVFSTKKSYGMLKQLGETFGCGISVDRGKKAVILTCPKRVKLPWTELRELLLLISGPTPVFSCTLQEPLGQYIRDQYTAQCENHVQNGEELAAQPAKFINYLWPFEQNHQVRFRYDCAANQFNGWLAPSALLTDVQIGLASVLRAKMETMPAKLSALLGGKASGKGGKRSRSISRGRSRDKRRRYGSRSRSSPSYSRRGRKRSRSPHVISLDEGILMLPITDFLSKIGKDMKEPPISAAGKSLKDEGIQQAKQLFELHSTDFNRLRLPLLLKTRLGRIRYAGGYAMDYLSRIEHQGSDQDKGKQGEEPGDLREFLVKIASDSPTTAVDATTRILQDEGVEKKSQLLELARAHFEDLCIPLLLKTRLRDLWKRGVRGEVSE